MLTFKIEKSWLPLLVYGYISFRTFQSIMPQVSNSAKTAFPATNSSILFVPEFTLGFSVVSRKVDFPSLRTTVFCAHHFAMYTLGAPIPPLYFLMLTAIKFVTFAPKYLLFHYMKYCFMYLASIFKNETK